MPRKETRFYDIDCDRLSKGDVISEVELQKLVSQTPGTKEYALAVLGLRTYIERRLKRRGYLCTLAQRKNQLCILTDVEASAYGRNAEARNIRAIGRQHEKITWVDQGNLTEEEKKTHKTTLLESSSIVMCLAIPIRQIMNHTSTAKAADDACKTLMRYSPRFL